jgi:Zn finger protein HypA/HybF involved in hydrogenase expression
VRRVFFFLCCFGVFRVAVATAADYVGAEACGACHREQFEAQSRSGHSRSLSRAAEHPLAGRFDGLEVRLDGSFQYGIERRDNALLFQVRQGDSARQHVIDWAFGAGQQAVTFVSRLDEDSYAELRASFYPGNGLALTPGHQNQHPASVTEALGVRYKIFSPRSEILSCFGCHSTGTPALGEAFEIRPAELGVRCESCHGPGREHTERIAQGEVEAARRAIGNPARLRAEAQMEFCGQCHRPPASDGVAIDWSDPWNVRHQPVYLTRSACFQKSAGGLSCQGCHDPHEALRRNDTAFYNEKCVACHSVENHPPAVVCRSEPGCVSCHMPAVQPQPELAFHNHWIGVYAKGDALRPQR